MTFDIVSLLLFPIVMTFCDVNCNVWSSPVQSSKIKCKVSKKYLVIYLVCTITSIQYRYMKQVLFVYTQVWHLRSCFLFGNEQNFSWVTFKEYFYNMTVINHCKTLSNNSLCHSFFLSREEGERLLPSHPIANLINLIICKFYNFCSHDSNLRKLWMLLTTEL